MNAEFPVIQMPAPLTARGYVRYVNIRPDLKRVQMWICDDCGGRVTEAHQLAHAQHHRV